MNRASTEPIALNLRAVGIGTVVDIAGSLVMTTVIGLTAITAMLLRGVPAQAIVERLPGSFALVMFCAAAGLMMSLAGGYVAARTAGHAHLRHALFAGLLAIVLNFAINAIFGDSGPLWLSASMTALILPCAALGGWLATPTG